MSANTARIQVGRLLEVRVAAGYRSVSDVAALFQQIGREVARLPPGAKHVTIADWRHCPVMAPEAADFLTARMAGVNPGTERSAVIARQDAPVAVLQFLRVIRDAGFSDRRLFFSEDELCSWLADVLSPAEGARLRAFLNEPGGA
ncbi:MAG TPA: hypothetical protein VJN18_26135 [Polyangiaceae bacterium]|nr:hypothetical protein [Polyangiaceae bacterium]